MRCLVLTPDDRFGDSLIRGAPDGVTFLLAADAAAAVRLLAETEVQTLLLDSAAHPEDASDFLRWWQAAPERAVLPVLFAVAGRTAQIPAGAQRTARDPEVIARALLEETPLVLDRTERELSCDGLRVRLTPSEVTLMGHLLDASEPVPTASLAWEALGYREQAGGSVVRTHLSNLRSKCAEVGLPDPIAVRRGQGYRLVGVRPHA